MELYSVRLWSKKKLHELPEEPKKEERDGSKHWSVSRPTATLPECEHLKTQGRRLSSTAVLW